MATQLSGDGARSTTSSDRAPRPRLPAALWAVIVVVVLGVVTGVQTLPVPSQWGSRFVTNAGDPALAMWQMRLQAHMAGALHLGDLMQANIFHPHADATAYSESFLAYLPVFGPALRLTGDNPIAAYNLVLFLGYLGGALAVYALARHLIGRRVPALAAAMLFTLAPYRSGAVGHIPLVGIAFAVLALLFLLRFLEDRRLLDAALVGLFAGLTWLGALYCAVMLEVTVAALLVVWAVQRRGRVGRRFWPGLALAGIVAVTVMAPTLPAYLRVERSGAVTRSTSGLFTLRPDGLRHLPPGLVYSHLFGTTDPVADTAGFFPGAALAIAASVGIVVLASTRPWRAAPRGAAGAHAQRWRAFGLPLLAAAAVCLAVMVGPNHSVLLSEPDRVMRRVVPGMVDLRDLTRFWLVPLVVAALLGGLAFAELERPLPRRALGTVLGCAILLVACGELLYRQGMVPVYTGPPQTDVDVALASMPPGVVMELPLPDPRSPDYAYVVAPRQLRSTIDANPRVEGYSSAVPDDIVAVIDVARTFPEQAAIDALRADGVRYVALHAGSRACAGEYSPEEMDRIVAALAVRGGVERVLAEGADRIVVLAPAPIDRSRVTGTVPAARSAPLCDIG